MLQNIKYHYLLLLTLLFVSIHFCAAQQTDSTSISGVELNQNRYFKFNDDFRLSFGVELNKGYNSYLVPLVSIVDINKQEVNTLLNIHDDVYSELLIISKNKLSKCDIKITKEDFQNNIIPFTFLINLKTDQLEIHVKDTVIIESRLGLKAHSDYKVTIGDAKTNRNEASALKLYDVESSPDLLRRNQIENSSNSTLIWIAIIVILDIFVFGYIIYRNRKRKKAKQMLVEELEVDSTDIVFYPYLDADGTSQVKNSCITLFKQFDVLDKDGNDITSRLTPLLKELFLILLLFSHKDEKGVSTGLLKDLLWFDKEPQSANNNRAVNIGKLKGILASVGGFDITSTPQNIRIDLKDDIYCDYLRVQDLLSEDSLDKEDIIELISLTCRGAFLPECSYEWLDSFKAEMSDKLIDNFLNISEIPNIRDDDKLLIQIADTIFNMDNLNDKALIIKCKALFNLGKRSVAIATYNKFVKDYETTFDTPYPTSFLDITS